MMNAVIRRISLIEAAPDLDALHHSVGRFEALESSVYEYSLRLDKGMRLVFSPYEPIPFKSDGGVDEKRVVEVLILKITNYH
ncbi:MAG: hypothetical protein IJU03_01100 [Thermoguttaceae bacterium]|nr:hypothetical protein [Thermoguttaceae bacterium]